MRIKANLTNFATSLSNVLNKLKYQYVEIIKRIYATSNFDTFRGRGSHGCTHQP